MRLCILCRGFPFLLISPGSHFQYSYQKNGLRLLLYRSVPLSGCWAWGWVCGNAGLLLPARSEAFLGGKEHVEAHGTGPPNWSFQCGLKVMVVREQAGVGSRNKKCEEDGKE